MELYYENYEKEKEKRKIYLENRRKNPEIIEKHKAYMNRRRREAGIATREEMYANLAIKRLKRHLRDMKPVTVLDLVLAEQDRYDKGENSFFGLTLYSRQKAKLRKAIAKGNAHFGHISRAEMIKRWKDFDNSCAYCGHKPADPLELEVEHVQPISQGGPHTLSNIVPACKTCNTSKNKHDMVKWYRKKPFYNKKREAHIKQVLVSSPYPEQQLELLHQWQVAG